MKYLHKPGFAKLFSLAIALVMSVNMGGCENKTDNCSFESVDMTIDEINNEKEIMYSNDNENNEIIYVNGLAMPAEKGRYGTDIENSIPFPDGLNVDLLQTYTINGETITFPCTIKELSETLGKDFTFREKKYSGIVTERIEGRTFIAMLYKKQPSQLFMTIDKDYKGGINEALVEPCGFGVSNLRYLGFDFSMPCGLMRDSTQEDAFKIFGKECSYYNDSLTNQYLIYHFKNEKQLCTIKLDFQIQRELPNTPFLLNNVEIIMEDINGYLNMN